MGALLNADNMAPTGVEVHMRCNGVITSMLMDQLYEKHREPDDTVVVGYNFLSTVARRWKNGMDGHGRARGGNKVRSCNSTSRQLRRDF